MALQDSESIQIVEGDNPDCVKHELKIGEKSPLITTDDGVDIKLGYKNSDDPLDPLPTCTASESNQLRNSLNVYIDEQGRNCLVGTPSGRKWTETSDIDNSAGAGPAQDSTGDVILIPDLKHVIKACCYPLKVKARLDVCDWETEPPAGTKVANYLKWTHTTTNEDLDETVASKKCNLSYTGDVGSRQYHTPTIYIPAGSETTISAELGLNYLTKVDTSFPNRLGSAQWQIDIEECPEETGAEDGC